MNRSEMEEMARKMDCACGAQKRGANRQKALQAPATESGVTHCQMRCEVCQHVHRLGIQEGPPLPPACRHLGILG